MKPTRPGRAGQIGFQLVLRNGQTNTPNDAINKSKDGTIDSLRATKEKLKIQAERFGYAIYRIKLNALIQV